MIRPSYLILEEVPDTSDTLSASLRTADLSLPRLLLALAPATLVLGFVGGAFLHWATSPAMTFPLAWPLLWAVVLVTATLYGGALTVSASER